MSYILDALKKSEQERGHGSAPGVQTIHSSSINYHQDKRAVWPWFLLAAVIINIIALVYFIYSRSVPESVALPAQTTITTERALPSASIQQQLNTRPINVPRPIPVVTEEMPAIEKFVEEETMMIEPETPQPAVTIASEIIDLYDLPLNIKQRIPEMSFSAHVYSTNPQQRSLVINGRFMEEGYQLSNELTLIEITTDGAIFDFQGHRFRTSVLSGWN